MNKNIFGQLLWSQEHISPINLIHISENMSIIQSCGDTKDCVDLFRPQSLYLKPIARYMGAFRQVSRGVTNIFFSCQGGSLALVGPNYLLKINDFNYTGRWWLRVSPHSPPPSLNTPLARYFLYYTYC